MDNEKKLNLIGLLIKIIVAVPALFFGLIVMVSGVNAESSELEQLAFMDSFSFDAAINISIYAILITVALILFFFIVLLITRPVQALKSILGIIISVVLFFVLYLIGTTDTLESLNVVGDITAGESAINFTHAGIYTAIVGLIVCSILAVFMGFIMKLIKN